MRQQSPSPGSMGSHPNPEQREGKGSSGSIGGENQRGPGPPGRLRPHHPRPRAFLWYRRPPAWEAGSRLGLLERPRAVLPPAAGLFPALAEALGPLFSTLGRKPGGDWAAGLGKSIDVAPAC